MSWVASSPPWQRRSFRSSPALPASARTRRRRAPARSSAKSAWHAFRLYVRFPLSYHDVEHLLVERGCVSYERARWVLKFGPLFALELIMDVGAGGFDDANTRCGVVLAAR